MCMQVFPSELVSGSHDGKDGMMKKVQHDNHSSLALKPRFGEPLPSRLCLEKAGGRCHPRNILVGRQDAGLRSTPAPAGIQGGVEKNTCILKSMSRRMETETRNLFVAGLKRNTKLL